LLICLQDNCAKVCCFVLYLLDIGYAKLTKTQNSGTNFAIAQKIDVIEVIERPTPPFLRHYFVNI